MVKLPDGEIRWFEYNGTVDLCHPKLWKTAKEVSDHWREDEPWKECNCNNEAVPVQAYTSYGSGISWTATACPECGVIVRGRDPYDCGASHGTPEWVTRAKSATTQNSSRINTQLTP